MNSKMTEMKNTPEGINSRKNETEEQVSDLEDRSLEITATEQNKEKRIRDSLGGPVVKTPCSQCRGPRFNPWSGN